MSNPNERIIAIAINTYRESIRSKILYSIIFFAALLLVVATFFGTVTIGDQIKVIKDFGLFSISIFSVAYAVIAGAALLHKELSRKTVFNILAKPVYRWEFLAGKYFGMLLTVAVMLVFMGAGLLLFAGLFQGNADILMLQAYYYIFCELVIICAAAIFFSSIVVTPMLSGLFTFGLFLAGRAITSLLYFVKDGSVTGLLALILKALKYTLPNLEKFNVSNQIVYGHSLSASHMFWSGLYAAGYAAVLLILATVIFGRREFN
ncbi:MAG: hypothetical protein D6719_04580 [Candidatus Dadabacteria bacterium]|nr:MAG: hypothetical protein D6719_04580 [Candidatus Dadabacteria bacterium]